MVYSSFALKYRTALSAQILAQDPVHGLNILNGTTLMTMLLLDLVRALSPSDLLCSMAPI
jgi:hypothetical protein